jgi:hypothetical protein
MPEKIRYRCTCGNQLSVIYDRTASNPGNRFKDLNGNPLPEMEFCNTCGKRVSLETRGYNPLSVEK